MWDYLEYVARNQTLLFAIFAALVILGALAHRRWGIRASFVVVVLSWPILLGLDLLNQWWQIPRLFEWNSFELLFRMAWPSVTLDTAALAGALWFVRRARSVRGAIVRGVGSAAFWAFVMPFPLLVVSLGLMAVIPVGSFEYYYIDLRSTGLEALETAKPPLDHYSGGAIPLRYRAELDGREIEVRIGTLPTTLVQLEVHALTPGSPAFVIDDIRPHGCTEGRVREGDNAILADWAGARQPQPATCYGAGSPEALLTFHFVGGEGSLTLRGPIVKGGEYWLYNSL
jgi:hypothetical protein